MATQKVTKSVLIADVQALNEKNPGNITRNFYRAKSKYKEADWQKYFPKFSDFLAAAEIGKPEEPAKKKLEDLPVEEQSQVLHFKSKAQTLESSVKSLLKERGKYTALIEDLKSAVIALEPYPAQPILMREGASDTPIAAVVKLSDWQIGEVIEPSETEGFGAFNFAIAEQRAFKVVKKVLDWVHMHRQAGYNLRVLHIFSEADLVSGNIHYELEVTNEFPVTVASAKAGNLLAQVIAQFAPHFDEVVVWEMSSDNHGRLTRKNQSKQGALNNYSYLAHVICNEIIGKHDNVTIHMGEGTKLLADVMGKKFLISHGHHIMGQMGIPYYGMERDRAREAMKRQHTDKNFDYLSIGHWHVPAIIGSNILVNGSLTGTTEFDHMCGRHALPSQVSFMVHPKFGVFNWTAWKLDDGLTISN
jgi:hypothetical protein